jgi:hypothetical protein
MGNTDEAWEKYKAAVDPAVEKYKVAVETYRATLRGRN